MPEDSIAKPAKRNEWEIKDDLRAVKHAMMVFKDKERLEEVQELIKQKKDDQVSLDAIADGDMKKALGLE
ncbi:MAG: hypothetical protein Q9M40_07080 [Sulfurimonas sp.]|nr:hypothetical protein [Sulfurimonas sp.]MDQ7067737.1 hypothetical protein [Sulfurimonas sp.]